MYLPNDGMADNFLTQPGDGPYTGNSNNLRPNLSSSNCTSTGMRESLQDAEPIWNVSDVKMSPLPFD